MSKFSKREKPVKEKQVIEKPVKEKPPKKKGFSFFSKQNKQDNEEEVVLDEELVTEELEEQSLITKSEEQGVFVFAPSSIYEEVINTIRNYEGLSVTGCSDADLVSKYFSEQTSQHIIILMSKESTIIPIVKFLSSLEFDKLPKGSMTVSIAITSALEKSLLPELKQIKGISSFASIIKSPSSTEIPISVIPNFMSKIILFQPEHKGEQYTESLPKVPTNEGVVKPPSPLSETEKTLKAITEQQDIATEISNVIDKLIQAKDRDSVEKSLSEGSSTFKAMDNITDELYTSVMNNNKAGNAKEVNSLIPALLSSEVKRVNTATSMVQRIVQDSLNEITKLRSKINDCVNTDLEINQGYETTSEVLLQKREELRKQVNEYLEEYKQVKVVSLRAIHTNTVTLEDCNSKLTSILNMDTVSKEALNVTISVIKMIRENIDHSLDTRNSIQQAFKDVLSLADALIDAQQKLIQLDDDIFTVMTEQKLHLSSMIKTHIQTTDSTVCETMLKEKASFLYLFEETESELYKIFKYGLTRNDVVIRLDKKHTSFSNNRINVIDFLSKETDELSSDTPLEIKINDEEIDIELFIGKLEKLAESKKTILVVCDAVNPNRTNLEKVLLQETTIASIMINLNSPIDIAIELNKLRTYINGTSNIKHKKVFIFNFLVDLHLARLEELKSASGLQLVDWDMLKLPPITTLDIEDISIESKVNSCQKLLSYMRRN